MEVDLFKECNHWYHRPLMRKETSADDLKISREFGYDFFDGHLKYGYSGYQYNLTAFRPAISNIIKRYAINKHCTILDVGCAKGLAMFDFRISLKGLKVKGLDISPYAKRHAVFGTKDDIVTGSAEKLPFQDKQFHFAMSLNTLSYLNLDDCKAAILELQRVALHPFLTVDAYRNDIERHRILTYGLSKTVMHVDDWKSLFKSIGYTGDYFWLTP